MKNTGSNVLFNTDFASLSGLTSLQGTWAVVNGQLVPTGSGENRIAFGSTAWTDVELDLSATLNAGRGFGVYYRSDGKANISGYCFQYDPGLGNKFVVRKVNGGSESAPIASFNMPAGFNVYGAQHDIVIKVVGDKHVITVDGKQVLSFTDATYKTGSAGLRSWDGGSSVSFASAKALGSGAGSAGSGDPSKGDFAYAYDGQTPSYGLVGWLAGSSAFVIQPLSDGDAGALHDGLHPHRAPHRHHRHRHPRGHRHPGVRQPAGQGQGRRGQGGQPPHPERRDAYAVDHGGAYPATEYVTYTPGDRTADNLGNRYLDTWPRNPWTGQPMANSGSTCSLQHRLRRRRRGRSHRRRQWTVVDGKLVPPASGRQRPVRRPDLDRRPDRHDGDPGQRVGLRRLLPGRRDVRTSRGYVFQYDPGVGNKFIVRKVVNGTRVGADRHRGDARRLLDLRSRARRQRERRRHAHRLQGGRVDRPRLQRRHLLVGRHRTALLGRQLR